MLDEGKTSLEDAEQFLSSSNTVNDAVYFKPSHSRQDIELPGGYSTSIGDEYNALQELYEEASNVVVQPLDFLDDPKGYFMEHVEGRSLQTVMNENLDDYDVESILDQANSLGSQIRESGVPHGDIRASNFLVTDSSGLKAIDPAGIPDNLEGPGVGSMREQAVTWDIVDMNQHIIDRVAERSNQDFDREQYYVDKPVREINQ